MTSTPAELKAIAAEIADGRHDGHLADVFAACRHRFAENVGLRWRITVPGVVDFAENEATIGEMAEVEDMLDDKPWTVINPESSAKECLALVLARLTGKERMTEDEAFEKVRDIPFEKFVEFISWEEVTPDPKGSSGPPLRKKTSSRRVTPRA